MAFPSVVAQVGGSRATQASSSVLTLPINIATGQLVLLLFIKSQGGSVSWPASPVLTELYTDTFGESDGAPKRFYIMARDVDGTEGWNVSPGATITVTHSADRMAYQFLQITDWHGSILPEVAVALYSTPDASPDPPARTASYGAADTMWVSACFYDDGRRTVTAYPTSHVGGANYRGDSVDGVGLGSATRPRNVVTEDPGPFTISAAEAWAACTLAVRPSGALGGSTQTARPISDISAGGWTRETGATSNLWDSIDELTTDDADYVKANALEDGAMEARLAVLAHPAEGPQVLRYRTDRQGALAAHLSVQLLQGSTVIGQWHHTDLAGGLTTHERTLTPAQSALITDWSNLRVRAVRVGADSSAADAQVMLSSAGGALVQESGVRRSVAAGGLWSNAATWQGGVKPVPGDRVVITTPGIVTADENAEYTGMDTELGSLLSFADNISVTHICHAGTQSTALNGNIINNGTIRMRPANSGVVHKIEFEGTNEALFVGSGMDPKPPDIGLWVMGAGKFDAIGTTRKPWTRTTAGLTAGQTVFTTAEPVPGWQAGDEIGFAPTEPITVSQYWAHYEVKTIQSIVGQTVTLSSGLTYDHPTATFLNYAGATKTFHPEIANLTSNVQIVGQPNKRVHVFIRSSVPQTLKHVLFRYMGPRRADADNVITGRWPLHFHHAGDGSRGSLVEGCVVRDCGSHAFVPHASHGITFNENVGYDNFQTPLWWDTLNQDPDTESDLIIFRKFCIIGVKSSVSEGDDGMFFSQATNSLVEDCVISGLKGNLSADPSAYAWGSNQGNLWIMHNNIAHNCFRFGTWMYNNVNRTLPLDGFIAYHCETAGIQHGAYNNSWRYNDTISYGCKHGLEIKANSKIEQDPLDPHPQTHLHGKYYGTLFAVRIIDHVVDPENVSVRLEECDFVPGTSGTIQIIETNGIAGAYDFVECTVNNHARDLQQSDFVITQMAPTSVYRVKLLNGTCFRVNADGTWTSIPAFP